MRRAQTVDRIAMQVRKRASVIRRPYVRDEDVRLVLERLPKTTWRRLEQVLFKDCYGRGGTLGYTLTRSRKDVVLCDLPTHLSLGSLCRRQGVKPEEFGAPERGQWPALAIRRFQLFNTLLHEIGHLQVVHPKEPNPRRKFADEVVAEAFAIEWRSELWSKPFDHPDPVHNPPDEEELALVQERWALAHARYRDALKRTKGAESQSVGLRLPEARAGFEAAVELFPQHSLALNYLGRCHFIEDGEEEKALEYFRRCRDIDPCVENNYLFGAITLSRLGREAEARAWFAEAIRFDHIAPLARTYFAMELVRMGHAEEAERLYKAILRRRPDHKIARELYDEFLQFRAAEE